MVRVGIMVRVRVRRLGLGLAKYTRVKTVVLQRTATILTIRYYCVGFERQKFANVPMVHSNESESLDLERYYETLPTKS